MKSWTIGKRIIFGFATVLVLVVIVAVTSTLSLRSIRKDVASITEDSLPGTVAMANIDSLMSEVQMEVLRHMLSPKLEDKVALEADIQTKREAMLKIFEEYKQTIHIDEDRQKFTKLEEARDQYVKARGPLFELSRAGKTQEMMDYNLNTLRPAFNAYSAACDDLRNWNEDAGKKGGEKIVSTVSRANLTVMALSVGAVVIGIVFAFFIVVGVGRVLTRLATSLNDGSSQVSSAAGQVSSASQTLAEGASEQAASLEETSSSLEEMASMTKRNSENAQKANDLAKQTRAAADKGASDMQTMSGAMEAIKVSSDDIAKIIKTIDEIAFQTNILALNAAVEAARAGEAGMGFAVVADEVRNLAQRSAQAAKETAAKIEGAITKTGQGVDISAKVAAALNDIVAKVRQVDELVAEVSGASREQTQGITQINMAVGQMDKVTQSNAANAEESAAAAEELNAQASVMKESVNELMQLVGGRGESSTVQRRAPAVPTRGTRLPMAKKPVTLRGNGTGHKAAAPLEPVSVGASALPLPDDRDFKDF